MSKSNITQFRPKNQGTEKMFSFYDLAKDIKNLCESVDRWLMDNERIRQQLSAIETRLTKLEARR